jgi:hypothetical protein
MVVVQYKQVSVFELQWLKLEEVYEQERQITHSSTQRGGVLGLLLHQTVSPNWLEEESGTESGHEMDMASEHDSETSSHNENETNLNDKHPIDNHTESRDSKTCLMGYNSESVTAS